MKQIVFNTEMVRAILEGRKTVTRRVVKPQPIAAVKTLYRKGETNFWRTHGADCWYEFRAPCSPGDILWVRETFTVVPDGSYIYKASVECPDAWKGTWKSPYYMTMEAARIFLRVTGVRVERLRNITEEQAEAEGAPKAFEYDMLEDTVIVPDEDGYSYFGFQVVWNSTIKPADLPRYGWDANPWVWVIEFERISKEEGKAK